MSMRFATLLVIAAGIGFLLGRSSTSGGPRKNALTSKPSSVLPSRPLRTDGTVALSETLSGPSRILLIEGEPVWNEMVRNHLGALLMPEQILAEFASNSQSGARADSASEMALALMAAQDPTATFDRGMSMPPGELRSKMLLAAINATAVSDPETATRMLEDACFDIGYDQAALPAFLMDDPAATMALAKSLPPSTLRYTLESRFAVLWARTDPAAAMEHASDRYTPTILQEWAGRDLTSMSLYFDSMPSGRNKESAGQTVAGSVAESFGIETALEWIETHLNERSFEQARLKAFGTLVHEKPQEALELAIAWDAKPQQLIGSWMKNDAKAALAWLDTLGDPELAHTLADHGLTSLAHQEPETAATHVEVWEASGGAALSKAVLWIGETWAAWDPAAAIEWAATRQNADQASSIIDSATRSLVEMDVTQAAKMLAEVPTGIRPSSAVETVHRELAKQSEVEAEAWMASLEQQN